VGERARLQDTSQPARTRLPRHFARRGGKQLSRAAVRIVFAATGGVWGCGVEASGRQSGSFVDGLWVDRLFAAADALCRAALCIERLFVPSGTLFQAARCAERLVVPSGSLSAGSLCQPALDPSLFLPRVRHCRKVFVGVNVLQQVNDPIALWVGREG